MSPSRRIPNYKNNFGGNMFNQYPYYYDALLYHRQQIIWQMYAN